MTDTFTETDIKRIGHTLDYWTGLLVSIDEDAAFTVIKPALHALTETELRTAVVLLVKAQATTRTALQEALTPLLDLAKEAGLSADEIATLELMWKGILA